MSAIDNLSLDKYLPVSKQNVGGAEKFVHLGSEKAPRQKKVMNNVSPDSSAPNAFTGSAVKQVFTLNSDRVHTPEWFILRVDVSNSDGANTYTPFPAPFLLSYVEIELSSNITETIYPEQLYDEYINNHSQEWLQAMSAQLNIDPATYNANAAIAASGTATYYIPIKCVISNALFMPACTTKPKINVYYRSGPQEAGAGSATALTLTSSSLYIVGIQYSDSIARQMLSRYKTKSHVKRSLVRQNGTLNFQNMTTTQVRDTINAFTGSFAYFTVQLIDASATAGSTDLYTPLDFTDITLLSSGGFPINYFQNVPRELLQNMLGGENFKGQGSSVKRILPYLFCVNPQLTYDKHIHTGSEIMDGKYQLLITPNISSATNVRCVLTGYNYATVETSRNGVITVKYL